MTAVTPIGKDPLAESKLDAFSQGMCGRGGSVGSEQSHANPNALSSSSSSSPARDEPNAFRDLLVGTGLKVKEKEGTPSPKYTPTAKPPPKSLSQLRESEEPVPPPSPHSPPASSSPAQSPLCVTPPPEVPDGNMQDVFKGVVSGLNGTDRMGALETILSTLGREGEAGVEQPMSPLLANQARVVVDRCDVPSLSSPRRARVYKAESEEVNTAFLLSLDLQKKPQKVTPARPRHPPQEAVVVGPDSYDYVGNMPSPAAVSCLSTRWSEQKMQKIDPDLREKLRQWEVTLRNNTEVTVRPLPGDDACEAPPAASVDSIQDKLKAAEEDREAAERRLETLSREPPSHFTDKQREFHHQSALAEKWRMQEAANKIHSCFEQLEAARSAGSSTPTDAPRSASSTERPPDTVRVSGPNSAVNGSYVKHLGRQHTYTRADGMTLYSDGVKWGFAQGAKRTPVVISLCTRARNPCSVWQWYEVDPKQGRYICNKRIKIEPPEAESLQDNVKALVAMGFPLSTVEEALNATAGSLEGALNILLQEGWNPSTPLTPTDSHDAKLERRLVRTFSGANGSSTMSPLDESLRSTTSSSSLTSNLPIPVYGSAVHSRQMQVGDIEMTRVLSNQSLRSGASYPAVVPPPGKRVKQPVAPRSAPLSVAEQMQQQFPQLDKNAIGDVVRAVGDDVAACTAALSEIAGTAPVVSPTQGRPVRTKQRLPQYRVVPNAGVSFRKTPNVADIESTFAGPRGGDVISAQNVVGDFVQLENGFYVPITKEGRALLQRIDCAEEESQRALGAKVGDLIKDASELHYALRNGRVQLALMLLEAGAPADVSDENGVTPLEMAESHVAFNAGGVADTVISLLASAVR